MDIILIGTSYKGYADLSRTFDNILIAFRVSSLFAEAQNSRQFFFDGCVHLGSILFSSAWPGLAPGTETVVSRTETVQRQQAASTVFENRGKENRNRTETVQKPYRNRLPIRGRKPMICQTETVFFRKYSLN